MYVYEIVFLTISLTIFFITCLYLIVGYFVDCYKKSQVEKQAKQAELKRIEDERLNLKIACIVRSELSKHCYYKTILKNENKESKND